MEPLDYFAWIVFCTMVLCLLGILAFLGMWPGRVARQRQHPYVDAITTGSWITLLAAGVLWPIILIWAYATPDSGHNNHDDDKHNNGENV